MRLVASATAILLFTAGRSDTFAWGCDGHRALTMVAERLMGAGTLAGVRAVLAASPVDPALQRFCAPVPGDLVADVSTWADDQRAADPTTGGWHFINFPLAAGSRTATYRKYCRRGNCAIDAVAAHYRTLKTSSDPVRRADALRYIIHIVGDLHQPLHAITNGDRGGNCVPVWYAGAVPLEDERGNFSPNLHGVWDFNFIRALMTSRGLPDASALAGYLVAQEPLPRRVVARPATTTLLASWARAANARARLVSYERLPTRVPIEPSTALTLASCGDNHDVGHRMFALHEDLDGAYEKASTTVIINQLRLAAIHLAEVLTAAFPEH